nr:MAG: hypothetical protein CM15mV30_0670 [uncultured marine virus]
MKTSYRKLDKMQIKVADAEQRRTQLEVDLQNIKNKIIDYNKTIKKLEADANATIVLLPFLQN